MSNTQALRMAAKLGRRLAADAARFGIDGSRFLKAAAELDRQATRRTLRVVSRALGASGAVRVRRVVA